MVTLCVSQLRLPFILRIHAPLFQALAPASGWVRLGHRYFTLLCLVQPQVLTWDSHQLCLLTCWEWRGLQMLLGCCCFSKEQRQLSVPLFVVCVRMHKGNFLVYLDDRTDLPICVLVIGKVLTYLEAPSLLPSVVLYEKLFVNQ